MRKFIDHELTALPVAGVNIGRFDEARHRLQAHLLLHSAYSNGLGYVPDVDPWWKGVSSDEEFDPALLTVAENESGEVIGFLHAWDSGFVKDVAVAASARRRGIGTALLNDIFHAFKRRGASRVDLKVMSTNYAAIALYKAAGMSVVNEVG
ncbi:hypothetical protein ASE94_00055 [Devosia sp. Leaf64]|nr:hypothetical protein ASE94_00055 [Devosia sp. Leaf64]